MKLIYGLLLLVPVRENPVIILSNMANRESWKECALLRRGGTAGWRGCDLNPLSKLKLAPFRILQILSLIFAVEQASSFLCLSNSFKILVSLNPVSLYLLYEQTTLFFELATLVIFVSALSKFNSLSFFLLFFEEHLLIIFVLAFKNRKIFFWVLGVALCILSELRGSQGHFQMRTVQSFRQVIEISTPL